MLLSPAAASFDMFVDYAARGRAFKAAVADLVAADDVKARPAGGGTPVSTAPAPHSCVTAPLVRDAATDLRQRSPIGTRSLR